MDFALTTHWNAQKHRSGESMIQEILDLGFNKVELGYDLTLDLVPGVRRMVENGSIQVCSVHNFCPVPIGAPQGHPELFYLASTDPRQSRMAIKLTADTIEFAADVGATHVVAHAGYVDMNNITRKLSALAKAGKQFEPKFEKLKMKLIAGREKRITKTLDALRRSIDELLPLLEKSNIVLALENLPSWEAVPSESEMLAMCQDYDSPHLRYWHDMGHGQVRQSLGFIGHQIWLDKLLPYTAGIHIHDTMPHSDEHMVPSTGTIDFDNFKQYFTGERLLVFEPAPGTPPDKLKMGLEYIQNLCSSQETEER